MDAHRVYVMNLHDVHYEDARCFVDMDSRKTRMVARYALAMILHDVL